MFVKSEKCVYGTLHFDLKNNAIENYTLALALTNKKWLKTRVEHQLTAQTNRRTVILLKKYWYSIDPQDSHDE